MSKTTRSTLGLCGALALLVLVPACGETQGTATVPAIPAAEPMPTSAVVGGVPADAAPAESVDVYVAYASGGG